MIGELIGGRYEVLAQIGSGGFGRVYRARDRLLAREVAIKIVADGTAASDRASALRQEAQVLAQLHHAGVVSVYDLIEHDGAFVLVMELVPGHTVSAGLADGEIPLERTLAIMGAVADALAHCHAHGICHGDLSLENVLVDDSQAEPRVTLIDFGLGGTAIEGEDDRLPELRGTPAYMAPEQVQGGAADSQTDVYAFGICLYRLLAGRFPFSGDYLAGLSYSIRFEEPPPLPPATPLSLAKLTLQCLDKEPGSRPQGFAPVFAVLRSATGETAMGHPSLAPAVAPKRNPYLNRVMIADPRDFFGRGRELRRIFSRLDAPQPQSIAVMGDRRIGKSSLLNHVFHPEVRRANMQHVEDSIFVFLDFQGNVAEEEGRFLQLLVEQLPVTCRSARSSTSSCSYADLEEAVARLDSQGRRLVVLMDEFDRITQNGRFTQSFFSFLRSLANRFKVAYVTASYAELQALCHTRQIADSPFFNIFSNLPLGPLLREDGLALVNGPSSTQGVALQPWAERLLDLAGLRPMYLQIACSCLFELADAVGTDAVDWDAFRDAFREECQPHYAFAWGRLSNAEQGNLMAVARRQAVDKQYAHVNDDLRVRGFLVEVGGKLQVESEAFREFILHQDRGSRPSMINRLLRRSR